MKRREYILLSATLLIAFTSCDKSINQPEPATEGNRIDFAATGDREPFATPPLGRGSETTTATMQSFGVYAYYAADGTFNTTLSPNFMCNTQVTKNNGQWGYTPLMYWPNSGTLSFFAYSPYASDDDSYIILSSGMTTPGYPKLTYMVPDVVTDQQDLLVSVPLINQTKQNVNSNGKLPLTFKHALSCLVFQAKMTNACSFPVKVTSIKIGKLKNKADFKYDETPGIFSWTTTSDATDQSYTLSIGSGLEDSDISTIMDYTPISSTDSRLLLIPQTIEESDLIEITVEYTTGADILSKKVTTPLNALTNTLETGKRYSINILVSALIDISLECTVEAWTSKTVNVPDFK